VKRIALEFIVIFGALVLLRYVALPMWISFVKWCVVQP